MKIISPPKVITSLFHSLEWAVPATSQKKIYLSFDDGPTPSVTDFVLNELDKAKASATFFCIGKNIANEPNLFKEIHASNHQIGNHTQNHVNGWKTSTARYLKEIEDCQNEIISKGYKQQQKPLYRPPYGKITRHQINALKTQYRIVMWSILAYDWLPEKTENQCLKNVVTHLKNGAIIVMHDSIKASVNLKKTLPPLLQIARDKGYEFGLI
jgi:peptidoglycan/xylan/chitin deacetylase (PgdA/CDA1 family)